jgi:glycosyltransferase involved in cell wall biosynthesis
LRGDGPLRTVLRQRHVPGVELPGRIDPAALRQKMLAARALVFPSVCHEAGPLAPVEAAAAGLPTIVSARVGIAHRIAESGAGWAVAAGDVAALADAITRLAKGPSLDAAGDAARVLYERSYSEAAAYRSLLEIYERAVTTTGAPPSPAPA